jgi:hypothetical protein
MRVLTGEHVGGDGVQALLVVTVAAVPASGGQPWLASGSLFGVHATAPSSPWVPGSGSLGDQGQQGRPAGVAVINVGALVAGPMRVGKWGLHSAAGGRGRRGRTTWGLCTSIFEYLQKKHCIYNKE